MPLYEYRCRECTTTFELLRPTAARELAAECPRCASRATMPLISLVAAPRGHGAEAVASPDAAPGGCCGGGCGCGAG